MRRFAKAKRTGSVALPVLAAFATLVLSGCGGGAGDSSGGTTSQATSAAEAKKSPEANQGEGKEESEEKAGSNVSQPEGEREPGISPQQKRKATKANILLESQAIRHGKALSATFLPAKYTCDGKDTWLPLRWKGVPPEAQELVLMTLSVDPEEELLFDWAVAGLDPRLTQIEEGKLPAGAIVGENSFGNEGYHACPPKGNSETFVFLLFAVPKRLAPKPGFDAEALREEVLAEHGNVGILNASYTRK